MNDGQSNHGFLWILQNEQKYRSVFAASSDYSDPAKRPKLVVTYQPMKKYFYLKDHLGNIRVTIDENGDVKGYNEYGESHHFRGYPFGLRMSERSVDPDLSGPGRSMNTALNYALYKYSSKELDEENGINWYYFGAHYYDPAIGRWLEHSGSPDLSGLSVDPLVDDYPSWAPYNYVKNNPLIIVDKDGNAGFKLNFDGFNEQEQEQLKECFLIKNNLLKYLGLPVSVGIAPTKTLAKIAILTIIDRFSKFQLS